jgi:hypothetical protein
MLELFYLCYLLPGLPVVLPGISVGLPGLPVISGLPVLPSDLSCLSYLGYLLYLGYLATSPVWLPWLPVLPRSTTTCPILLPGLISATCPTLAIPATCSTFSTSAICRLDFPGYLSYLGYLGSFSLRDPLPAREGNVIIQLICYHKGTAQYFWNGL